MSTLAWKKIVFEDEVPNIGNTDLTIPSLESRNLKIGGAAKYFNIQGADDNYLLQATQALVYLGNQNSCVLSGFFTTETQLFCQASIKTISCEDVSEFRIESHNDEATAGPILNLVRDPDTPGGVDSDELARINFQGDNESGQGIPYADVTAKIIDSDDTLCESDLIFRVRDKGQQQPNLGVTQILQPNPAGELTTNEMHLGALKVRDKTLEELTRRTQMVYQCGYNGELLSLTTNGAFNEHELRVSNGVQVIDGSNYTNSTGIIMPFDGYVAGGSFSCVRHAATVSTSGRLRLVLKKYTPGGVGNWDEDLEVASALPGTSTPHPVSTTYTIPGTTVQRSEDVKVLKGDMILPFFHVGTQVMGDTYRVDDVIAQFVIYSEEKSQ
tara:strand:+ start:2829 stop:3980 length:1152 start_codon:yes stop_codon:yes gene_type:complete